MWVRVTTFFSVKEIRVMYSECVFVALVNMRVKRIRHFICGLPRSNNIFPHCLSNNQIFGGKKKFLSVKSVF